MSWPQIELALKEKRHELALTGKDFNEHLIKHGMDPNLFKITSLNYLTIHDTTLDTIPEGICQLAGLQTLSLHSNKISNVDSSIQQLDKLKVLDLSHNCISMLQLDFNCLLNLTTINLSNNKLEEIPSIEKCVKLQVLDLSNNLLSAFPNVCNSNLNVLSDLRLGNNKIPNIPDEIDALVSLKNLAISNNQITIVTGNLINCTKLKELYLKDNPIKDRRLFKLIDQCRTKQVLDYIKQHCVVKSNSGAGNKKKQKNNNNQRQNSETDSTTGEDFKYKLKVKHSSMEDDALKIIIKEEVRSVRPFITTCLLHGVEFNEDLFRKFIQLQNKMHETICDRRNAATIATHDAKALESSKLIYTAVKPSALKIKPLNRGSHMSGEKLFASLQAEAENLRKEKKRNIYSGIHKYLYLLEGKPLYPCLEKQTLDEVPVKEVISFPPITNSDATKISLGTTSMFLEVTSSTNGSIPRKIMDELIQETIKLFNQELVVEQIRVVDIEGNMKSVYPSKTDLNFDPSAKIQILRD